MRLLVLVGRKLRWDVYLIFNPSLSNLILTKLQKSLSSFDFFEENFSSGSDKIL